MEFPPRKTFSSGKYRLRFRSTSRDGGTAGDWKHICQRRVNGAPAAISQRICHLAGSSAGMNQGHIPLNQHEAGYE